MCSPTFLIPLAILICMPAPADDNQLLPRIEIYVKDRLAETTQIPKERQDELLKLSRYIDACRKSNKPVKLLFVCTHNSRRSHLAQLWTKIGAKHFGLDGLDSFSGGTETTAMNPRTVTALQRAGLEITKEDSDTNNPKYSVVFCKQGSPEVCFSKSIIEPPNPTENFAAIMTCSSADVSCPNVKGSDLRLALPYEDPKISDGTSKESATYDAKSKEIAREMLFVMSRVVEKR